jgi:hypothetical protein
MRRTKRNALILTTALALTFLGAQASAAPQPGKQPLNEQTEMNEAAPASSMYRVKYTVNEAENGKTVNSRSYTLVVNTNSTATVRIGSRVPYGVATNAIQYQDVGMNIECTIKRQEGNLLLHSKVEMMSLAGKGTEKSFQSIPNPVFGQFELENDTVATLGKTALVGSADDIATNRHYVVEVTVTKAQ